jgi:hypothetical protein
MRKVESPYPPSEAVRPADSGRPRLPKARWGSFADAAQREHAGRLDERRRTPRRDPYAPATRRGEPRKLASECVREPQQDTNEQHTQKAARDLQRDSDEHRALGSRRPFDATRVRKPFRVFLQQEPDRRQRGKPPRRSQPSPDSIRTRGDPPAERDRDHQQTQPRHRIQGREVPVAVSRCGEHAGACGRVGDGEAVGEPMSAELAGDDKRECRPPRDPRSHGSIITELRARRTLAHGNR